MKSPSKIAIIGAGNVGAAVAYALTLKNMVAEILLIDVNQEKETGEVMDIASGLCFVDTGSIKTGEFKEVQSADIIIVTAGAAQKPGDTRLDLLEKNKQITKSIFKSIGKLNHDAIIIMVSNPVDVLTYLVQEITGLPKNQIFGSGTSLDTARLRSHVARILGVSAQSVHGYVMGEHGDSEFVAWSALHVGGQSVKNIKQLNAATRNKVEKSVRSEAYEIIKRKGATFFGIATAVAEIIEAVLYDQHKILPVSTRVDRYNGVSNVCLGVPAVIGRRGVERVWPLHLPADEKKKFQASAKVLKTYIKGL